MSRWLVESIFSYKSPDRIWVARDGGFLHVREFPTWREALDYADRRARSQRPQTLKEVEMTTNIDRAAKVLQDEGIGSDETRPYLAYHLARCLADAGSLRPPASERYDSTMTNLPSFSGHEGSPVDGPHIEASVERRYRKGALATFARVSIDLDGEHGAAYINIDTGSEWCRAAAAILLDVADALDTAQEKK